MSKYAHTEDTQNGYPTFEAFLAWGIADKGFGECWEMSL